MRFFLLFLGYFLLLLTSTVIKAEIIEINASPFATEGAPLPAHINTYHEKLILIDPNHHAYGAYNKNGKLIRWGIATAGADTYKTNIGTFRIYSLGGEQCTSKKYPVPTGGASMPYCMYFNGGEALHGSDDVQFNNVSHGCIRVHVSDAKWLRYQFVEGPKPSNLYRGTKIIIRSY